MRIFKLIEKPAEPLSDHFDGKRFKIKHAVIAVPGNDIASMVRKCRRPLTITPSHKMGCPRLTVSAAIVMNDKIPMKRPGFVIIKILLIYHRSLESHYLGRVIRKEIQQLPFVIMNERFRIKALVFIIND